ncbi:hypothetical protein AYK26_03625 [Euryarchaeota archaeon SM23-78]|nr:MAG: hypothetical protein AYK26_03625 [Euryarchaeota archaeon SM23-78]MBW3000537.1 PD-(D/E)XK nuclease family protein [Candidatus Woesearchaeota archaeon]
MLQHVSLDHGWYYHYRLHNAKLGLLRDNGFYPLHRYLNRVFKNCPQEPFLTGPRGSRLRFDLGIRPRQIDNHEVTMLAREGLSWNKYTDAHSNVQVFMLSYDNTTVGVEVPIWLRATELGKKHEEFFNSKEPLSGHIDVLRTDNDKVWVWDYKPRAAQEKYASTQVFFYSLMLSRRAGIPLDRIRCGYFDEHTAFAFKPDKKYLRGTQLKLR